MRGGGGWKGRGSLDKRHIWARGGASSASRGSAVGASANNRSPAAHYGCFPKDQACLPLPRKRFILADGKTLPSEAWKWSEEYPLNVCESIISTRTEDRFQPPALPFHSPAERRRASQRGAERSRRKSVSAPEEIIRTRMEADESPPAASWVDSELRRSKLS